MISSKIYVNFLAPIYDNLSYIENTKIPYATFKVTLKATGTLATELVTCYIPSTNHNLLQYALSHNFNKGDMALIQGEETIYNSNGNKYIRVTVTSLELYSKATEPIQKLDSRVITADIIKAVDEPIEVKFNDYGLSLDTKYFDRKEKDKNR